MNMSFLIISLFYACQAEKKNQSLAMVDTAIESSQTEPSSEETGRIDTSEPDDTAELEPPIFSLEFQITQPEPGRLTLESNLPITLTLCQEMQYQNLDCTDLDQDGLLDQWEELALEYFRPFLLLDEAEPFLDDTTAVFAQIARVAPTAEWIDLYIVLAWSKDYGRCGLSAHNGDSERVVIRLEKHEDNSASFFAVYTAAHEGEITDAGKVWQDAELGLLDFEMDPNTEFLRWVVYPSEAKHATFATIEHCENVSFIPCLDEDCAPDNVSDPNNWRILGSALRVGEEENPLADELSSIGFPNEFAWQDQLFCGGLGGDHCSSPVREKLLNNPF